MKSFTSSFFKPTNLHRMPYGWQWEQKNEDDTGVWWIQVSEDIEKPKWITLDQFFGKVFKEKMKKSKFMSMCLKLYEEPERRIWFRLY